MVITVTGHTLCLLISIIPNTVYRVGSSNPTCRRNRTTGINCIVFTINIGAVWMRSRITFKRQHFLNWSAEKLLLIDLHTVEKRRPRCTSVVMERLPGRFRQTSAQTTAVLLRQTSVSRTFTAVFQRDIFKPRTSFSLGIRWTRCAL